MKIQISGLSEGIHHYQFTVGAEELELGDEFHAQVAVEATLDKTPTQLVLTSTICTTATFACDRCTAPFEKTLAPSYRMFYTFEGADTRHLDPAEFQIIAPSQPVIDIADDVRQMILLAIPLKLLCKENCRGLCPTCGTNLNEGRCTCTQGTMDTRWEILRKLQGNA